VRISHRPRLRGFAAALAIALSLLATSLAWQVQAVAAGSSLNAQATELVRLINGDRAAAGKPALAVDPFLASKATNGAIPCPDDPTRSINGRTLDFATWGNMSHLLRLCLSATYALSSTPFVSVLQTAWGYGNVGEIDLVNGGYGNGQFLYTFAGGQTWTTWTYATTGHALMGWGSSPSHWAIVMGSYDRVGCGGWSSGATYYYDCVFSRGGPSPDGLTSPPTRSPFSDPVPTPPPPPPATPAPPTRAPAPVPKPVATSEAPQPAVGAEATAGSSSGAGTSASPLATDATASPAASGRGTSTGAIGGYAPGAGVLVGQLRGDSFEAPDAVPAVPTQLTGDMAVVAGSAAALLSAAYALLVFVRRRRRRVDLVT
jgi:hypothetical protein